MMMIGPKWHQNSCPMYCIVMKDDLSSNNYLRAGYYAIQQISLTDTLRYISNILILSLLAHMLMPAVIV
jgi:hypothetical protein